MCAAKLDNRVFPYMGLPDRQNWRKAVSLVDSHRIDPQGRARFKIDATTKIASAGSCFAQRIAQSLRASGYHYYDAEPAPAFLSPQQRADYSYDVYSARFGEIYTTLQLLQLAQRAAGTFEPVERSWSGQNGLLDPFRPTFQPHGFSSLDELEAERGRHLQAVKRMFTEIDVFVFTMGLTETWCHAADGAAYPICPGRHIGEFDRATYRFRNLGVEDNVAYLNQFLEILRGLNPNARTILSVSPVPLAATMEDKHVLNASTYSKAVLRVAAEEMRRTHPNVDYFAAYEIVTGTFNTAEYFENDRRTVTAAAIDHVMGSFYENFSSGPPPALDGASEAKRGEAIVPKPCDEDLLLAYINRDFDESPRRAR